MQQISLDIQLAPWPAPVPNPLLLCAGDRIVPFGPGAPDVSKASGQGFGARADRGWLCGRGRGRHHPGGKNVTFQVPQRRWRENPHAAAELLGWKREAGLGFFGDKTMKCACT